MEIDSGGLHDGFKLFHEIFFAQFFHGEVYGYPGDLIALFPYLSDLTAGFVQDDHTEAVNVAVFFRQRNKAIRKYQPGLGQPQTHQGFRGIVSTRVHIAYRLAIDQNTFIV